jgi:hypothetical protein
VDDTFILFLLLAVSSVLFLATVGYLLLTYGTEASLQR